jgi:hypothetical protein
LLLLLLVLILLLFLKMLRLLLGLALAHTQMQDPHLLQVDRVPAHTHMLDQQRVLVCLARARTQT